LSALKDTKTKKEEESEEPNNTEIPPLHSLPSKVITMEATLLKLKMRNPMIMWSRREAEKLCWGICWVEIIDEWFDYYKYY